jgi:hypothetical protein
MYIFANISVTSVQKRKYSSLSFPNPISYKMFQLRLDYLLLCTSKISESTYISTIYHQNTELCMLLLCAEGKDGAGRRKIRLIESNAKCRYMKKCTCKGTLRQVFYLSEAPSPPHTPPP